MENIWYQAGAGVETASDPELADFAADVAESLADFSAGGLVLALPKLAFLLLRLSVI